MISKITDDFKKIVAVAKLKELKQYVKNIFPNYKKWKIHNKKQKKIIIRKKLIEEKEMGNESLKNRNKILKNYNLKKIITIEKLIM